MSSLPISIARSFSISASGTSWRATTMAEGLAAACMAMSCTSSLNLAPLATKSVSQFTSISTPNLQFTKAIHDAGNNGCIALGQEGGGRRCREADMKPACFPGAKGIGAPSEGGKEGGFTAPVGHHYNHTCFEAGALQQSSPFKAPDADLLANCGSRLLDDGGHRLAGVLDEGLVQQGLLRQELLNAPVHNLAPASRRPLQHEHELLHLIFVYQQGKTRDRLLEDVFLAHLDIAFLVYHVSGHLAGIYHSHLGAGSNLHGHILAQWVRNMERPDKACKGSWTLLKGRQMNVGLGWGRRGGLAGGVLVEAASAAAGVTNKGAGLTLTSTVSDSSRVPASCPTASGFSPSPTSGGGSDGRSDSLLGGEPLADAFTAGGSSPSATSSGLADGVSLASGGSSMGVGLPLGLVCRCKASSCTPSSKSAADADTVSVPASAPSLEPAPSATSGAAGDGVLLSFWGTVTSTALLWSAVPPDESSPSMAASSTPDSSAAFWASGGSSMGVGLPFGLICLSNAAFSSLVSVWTVAWFSLLADASAATTPLADGIESGLPSDSA
ncbi:MAG: hypothetical protein FRX49_06641 [Trebouxia sp. A1-2]|nr:MAG: hypothetical protein FRX49_06641 [Trebouxia sp. A1-2]